MATAETARLIASLELKDQFTGTANKITRSVDGLDRSITSAGNRSYKAGQQIGTGIKNGAIIAAGAIGFLATQTFAGLRELAKLETATAQTNAVLASTKGVAGQTSASIRALAEEYEGLNATIDDKVIQSAENVLLTFTNIRKDAFEPALQAALDLNAAMGGGEAGLQGTIVKLGRAMSDPAKGLTALTRAGVVFTDQQKQQIIALQKSGDLLGAQKIILAELGKEFGGSFKAQGATAEGAIAGIGDAVEDLQKGLALGLFPVVQKVLPKIRAALADPAVIAQVTKFGDALAGLFSDENLAAGADFLKGAFQTAKEAAPVVGAAAKATFELVKAAVGLFKSLPPELQKLAVGAFAVNKLTGGLVTNIGGAIAGGLASFLAKSFTAGMNVNAGVVNVSGAGGLAGAGGAAAGAGKVGAVARVASIASKVFIVGAAVGVFAELKGILDEQSGRNRDLEAGLAAQTAAFTGGASLADLKQSLAGVDAQIADLSRSDNFTAAGLAFGLNIDGVRDAVNRSRSDLVAAITTAEGKAAAANVHAIERAEAIASGKAERIRAAAQAAAMASRRTEAAENRVATAVTAAKAKIASATSAAGQRTAAAIKDKDLSVTTNITAIAQVTNGAITKTQVTQSRISGKIPS